MLLVCFKLSPCLVGNTRHTSVMYEKAKFVCLYLMRLQKVTFESVQINMKHVLYFSCVGTCNEVCYKGTAQY